LNDTRVVDPTTSHSQEKIPLTRDFLTLSAVK
jgi:hypothetical protein